jgi:hypothetical protein
MREAAYRPELGQLDRDGNEIEDRIYNTKDLDRNTGARRTVRNGRQLQKRCYWSRRAAGRRCWRGLV